MAKQELVATIRDRYQQASKKDKGKILDEFTAITGHHRKHGIRLLGGTLGNKDNRVVGRRIYDEAVREAVIVVWEASDRICGKLKGALPNLVDSIERHGHLNLGPDVRSRLLTASAASLDRLLRPIRPPLGDERRRRRRPNIGHQIPVRTFASWNRPPPGYMEIDLVAHRGDNMSGSFVYNLVATDVCTGWTEAVPLLAREQSLVVAGLEAIAAQLPSPSPRHRLRQSQRIHQRLTGAVLHPTWNRVHQVKGLPQERPGMVRAEKRFRCPEVHRAQPLLGSDRWRGYGPPVQGGKAACELPPALFKAAGEAARRSLGHQGLQPTGHTLRPGHAERHYPCLDKRGAQ